MHDLTFLDLTRLQALLRIVKHCEDNLPAPSTGVLLGLEMPRGEGQGSVLQITYAFALPRGGRDAYDRDGDDEHDEDKGDREKIIHQKEMIKYLKEVRIFFALVRLRLWLSASYAGDVGYEE